MIGSDNRTIIFHKATARIVCTLSEDALAPNRGTIANHTNTNDSDTNNIPNTVPKTNWAPTHYLPSALAGASLPINVHHLVLVCAGPGRYGRLERQEERLTFDHLYLVSGGISEDLGHGNGASQSC